MQLGLSSALHFPISSEPRKRRESSPLESKVTCPRKAVTPGLQLRLPQETGVIEFPIKPPRPDPSPHICGNKKFPVGRGRCSLLPRPPRDPRRLWGRRGRQHQPQRAEPGKLQRAFRPRRGERQTPTRLSLSQQVPSSPAGADSSAPAAGRRGLRCARWGLPLAGWTQLQQLSSALAPGATPAAPRGGPEQGRGAGRAESGAAPPGTQGAQGLARPPAAAGSRPLLRRKGGGGPPDGRNVDAPVAEPGRTRSGPG